MIKEKNNALKKHTYNFTCMTTPCEVQLYAKTENEAKKIASLIERNTRRLEKKYNFFSDDSLVSTLNNRVGTNNIRIDKETYNVLSFVRTLSVKTKGSFDITVGTLKQCSKLPSIYEVEACRAKLEPYIGLDKWSLMGDEVHFSNDIVKIDLGGVIKEYAVDQAAQIAKSVNMSALINFGGDIYVNGNKPDGAPFTVALKNPKNPIETIALLKLSNQGLTTSAHYERSTVIEGKNYSHIIGGTESCNDNCAILSATVISDSVLTSGIYSTSLMINARLVVDASVNVVLIDEDLRIHQNIV